MTSPSDVEAKELEFFPVDYVGLDYLQTKKEWKVICKFDAAFLPSFMDAIGGPGGKVLKLGLAKIPQEENAS